MWQYNYSDELYHHGIKGMQWGVRRYQNKDGSLTPAGRKRYDEDDIVINKGDEILKIGSRTRNNIQVMRMHLIKPKTPNVINTSLDYWATEITTST